MDETFESKIKQLKAELQLAQQTNQLWNILIEKREILESQMAKLISEIDDNKNIAYRKPANDTNAKKDIDSKEKILKSIKSNKQEIDEKLDDLEGISEEIIKHLKNQLILAILEKHPEGMTEYKELELNCIKSEKLANDLRTLSELTKGVIKLCNNIIDETQQPKHFRLLNFFLGRSHYTTIQKYLHNLQMICGKTLDSLHNTLELTEAKSNISNQLKELYETIVQLQQITQTRWSSKKVDQYLIPLNEMIKSQHNNLMEFQQGVKDKARKEHDRIDQWIEKFT